MFFVLWCLIVWVFLRKESKWLFEASQNVANCFRTENQCTNRRRNGFKTRDALLQCWLDICAQDK